MRPTHTFSLSLKLYLITPFGTQQHKFMNTDDKNTSYQTPEGIVQGTPDIAVPKTAGFTPATAVPVGGVILADGDLEYNTNRETVTLKVRNTGDRPVQVGSHFHFFEVNRYLEFDRKAAFGKHLDIPATTAVRFEPGEEKEVQLCSYYGKRRVIGFNDLVNGYTGGEDKPSYYPKATEAMRRVQEYGFKNVSGDEADAEFTTPDK